MDPQLTSQPSLIRPALPADVRSLVGLITELAEFEHLTHLLQVTEDRLATQLFGPHPAAEAVVAEVPGEGPGSPARTVAFALFFPNFSTFLGKPGLYLEDLYVQPAYRGTGIGRQLLLHLAQLAVARDYGRFEWSVLDWNERAIRFYEGMGATLLPEWRICRVTGDTLAQLGRQGGADTRRSGDTPA